jgi:hypothetical protein
MTSNTLGNFIENFFSACQPFIALGTLVLFKSSAEDISSYEILFTRQFQSSRPGHGEHWVLFSELYIGSFHPYWGVPLFYWPAN